MLPAAARLRRREDFTLVVRRGRRAGRPTLVAHYLSPPAVAAAALPCPQAGFVVSRAVGGSVERHRVVRQLRHLVRDRLPALPPGSRLVVRALPPAQAANSAVLGRDLDAALARLVPALGQSDPNLARPAPAEPAGSEPGSGLLGSGLPGSGAPGSGVPPAGVRR